MADLRLGRETSRSAASRGSRSVLSFDDFRNAILPRRVNMLKRASVSVTEGVGLLGSLNIFEQLRTLGQMHPVMAVDYFSNVNKSLTLYYPGAMHVYEQELEPAWLAALFAHLDMPVDKAALLGRREGEQGASVSRRFFAAIFDQPVLPTYQASNIAARINELGRIECNQSLYRSFLTGVFAEMKNREKAGQLTQRIFGTQSPA